MADSYVHLDVVSDNSEEFQTALKNAIKRGLMAIGMTAERYAKEEISRPKPHAKGVVRPNVDTGRLRNSITFALAGEGANIQQYSWQTGEISGAASGSDQYNGTAPQEPGVYIGTNVEYAVDVELGGSKSKAYPFLTPAATEHNEEYKNLMEDSLKNA